MAMEKANKTTVSKYIFVVSMLILPIVSWLFFWLYTNIDMILLAFRDLDGMFTTANFKSFWIELTAPKGEIGISLRNTLMYFGMNVLLTLPMSVVVAYFIFKKITGYKWIRVLLFLPSIVPAMVMITAFKETIKPWGPLASLGITIRDSGLLADPTTATTTIMFYCFWTGISGSMLLMNGAMTRIPTEVFEAAKLDGCGPIRECVSIVVPLIMPTLSMQILFAASGILTSSGPILLMTGGAYETSTLSYWIFITTYKGAGGSANAYNVVSAAGLAMTMVTFPIVMLVKRLSDKIGAEEY